MIDSPPDAGITKPAFGDQTMDVRIPFKISAECMKHHNKTGSKVQGFVNIEKHTGNNTGDRMK